MLYPLSYTPETFVYIILAEISIPAVEAGGCFGGCSLCTFSLVRSSRPMASAMSWLLTMA